MNNINKSKLGDDNTNFIQPEFLRVKGVERMFGIKRGKLYALMNEGKIKSKTLRSRGTVRGIRLIDIQSVREFIHSSEE